MKYEKRQLTFLHLSSTRGTTRTMMLLWKLKWEREIMSSHKHITATSASPLYAFNDTTSLFLAFICFQSVGKVTGSMRDQSRDWWIKYYITNGRYEVEIYYSKLLEFSAIGIQFFCRAQCLKYILLQIQRRSLNTWKQNYKHIFFIKACH